ncbi:MAG: methyltransferase [Anaerolineaceae bacterium]|nr:methyltransferase [Anaerolineaceae bacterium]
MPDTYKDNLESYLDKLVPKRPSKLQKMEAYADKHGFPIIGPASGQACYQIARMIKAQRVFELGSGYGYSTAWFARAVRENGGGEVHHVVWDDDLSQKARNHLQALGYGDLIRYHVNEAVQTLRETDGPFDLIFNDIEKLAYPESVSVIEKKLRPGGVLIIDNMVWSGRVWDETEQSEATQAIRQTTEMLTTNPNWISSLLPIRDGLLVAYKVG